MKLINFSTLFLLICLMSGCIKEEIPDLVFSEFPEIDKEYFSLEKVEFENFSTIKRNVRIFFTSVYEELHDKQKANIEKILVKGEDVDFVLDLDRESFFVPERRIGTTVCYELSFQMIKEVLPPKSTTICVEVR